jgi:hypothetical protein
MEPVTTVLVAPTADRKTAPSSFGETLRAVALGAADGLAAASSLLAPIAPIAPAGMVLAGAVRGVAQAAAGGPRPASTLQTSLASTGAGGDPMESVRLLQQEGQSFNLRYLELQERMQRETREFTAVSNVMKVRHDAARAAIQNVQ